MVAFLAMCGLGVQAQSWTASEVGVGEFYLYNVGTGQFFTRGNGWGTQASITTDAAAPSGLKLTLEAIDTNYKLRTDVNGTGFGVEHLDGGTIYTDQSRNKNSSWTFTQVATDNGPVYTIVSANNHAGGNGVYMTAGVDGTIVTPGTDGTNEGARWKLLAADKLPVVASLDRYATIKAAAKAIISNLDTTTPDADVAAATKADEVEEAIVTLRAAFLAELPNVTIPQDPGYIDVTAVMVDNASVSTNTNYWTAEGTPNGNYSWGACNYGECEFYQQNFKFYQTLTLKSGTWEFGVTGFHRAGNHNTYFYAGEDKILIPGVESSVVNTMAQAKNYFDNGNGKVSLKFLIESEQDVEIGIDNQDTQTDKWTIFRNFTLKYYGPVDYSVYTKEWERLSKEANENKTNNPNVGGQELENLNSALNDAPSTTANKAEYIAKINALDAALNTFKNAITAYNSFAYEKTHAAKLGVTEFPNPTTTAEALEGVNTLKVAEHNAVINKYTTDGSALFIPSWDKTNFDALSNEHWSGTTSEYFDKWSGSAFTSKIYKEVTLPEGHYVFYAAARGQANASTATLKVTIGDNTLSVPCTIKGNRGYGINTSGAADFSPESTYACDNAGFGWEWRHIAFDLTEETTVTLAIECTGNNSWVSAGDTRLVTYDNIAVSQSRYEAALEAAKAARDNADFANITGVERDNLIDAINATTPTTKEGYDAAAETLENRLSVFTAAKASYDAYVAYKNETKSLFGDEVSNSITAPTTAAQAITAVQNLNIAQYNKVATDYTFSCSGLIGDFGSWIGTATVAGEKAEPNYLDREHWSGIRHAYYEQAAAGWQNAAGWTIQYKKTCTLPAGDYVIKVAARSSGGTTSNISCSATNETISLPNLGSPGRGINTSGVASWSDNDTFTTGNLDNNQQPAVGGNGTGWQWRFLPFTLSEQTEVTMTFYAEATSQFQWMSIADGELLSKTKLAEDVIYDEGATNIIENKLIADVTIDRNIKADFNTIVLPFELTANQVAVAFGDGTEVYNYSENSEDPMHVTINFNKGDGSIKANTPVLIKATTASKSQTFNGVQVVAATEAKVEGTHFDFVGTYEPSSVPEGDYFIGSGAIYQSEGATSINAFRAYIKAKTANARIISFAIDDKATDIEGIEIEGAKNGKIYNLNGQEVKNPQKGVYIQNGKIFIIK